MANESTLRDLLRSADDGATAPIDTGAVIRRSKARRLPRQIGVGGVFTLAIGGIGIAGLQGLGGVGPVSQSAESSTASDEPPETQPGEGDQFLGTDEAAGGISRAPAEKLNGCGGPLAEVAPSGTGVVLTAAFPEATAGVARVEGTVTMTNTGSETVTGYTAATPAVTLSQNGVVIWHSNGPTIQMIREVRLAPGESFSYATSVTPVVCGVDDEAAESFRDDLPPAPAGDYEVSAAIDLTIGDRMELVSGPRTPLRLG